MNANLGAKAKDMITGFEGTVVGVVDYITGCRQLLLVPSQLHEGKPIAGHWYDEDRVEILEDCTQANPELMRRIVGGAPRPSGPDEPPATGHSSMNSPSTGQYREPSQTES